MPNYHNKMIVLELIIQNRHAFQLFLVYAV